MIAKVLILPGLGSSGPEHWQSLWEARNPMFKRVEQENWDAPNCKDWVRKLQEEVQQFTEDIVLVAHSLACITVVHWARQYPRSIKGVLLVAPPDVEREDFPNEVTGFSPIPLVKLPFKSVVVASTNDEYVSIERARFFSENWGSEFINVGALGHINSASGLSDWKEGQELLQKLL
ncbi:RBBP9/YdeN family alpha/beta hydrolase [Pontibacter silvestris]|uniref:RBBP9/YdeN family alpha/beta hydrolase n=1 Tax=Pontibacter silvestris TaxID=2305183 RepID=A0ABW4X259_9BACT|nr:alpha/beta hydrolase [Pontibacter silvestris]MCC9134953.1 alpha/beta hydrolase [Pontibacter silvestris]